MYIARTRTGALYTGIATDVARRLREHEAAGPRGARALRGRGPLALVYTVEIGDRVLAQRAEHAIKRLPRAAKTALVATAPDARTLLRRLAIAGDRS